MIYGANPEELGKHEWEEEGCSEARNQPPGSPPSIARDYNSVLPGHGEPSDPHTIYAAKKALVLILLFFAMLSASRVIALLRRRAAPCRILPTCEPTGGWTPHAEVEIYTSVKSNDRTVEYWSSGYRSIASCGRFLWDEAESSAVSVDVGEHASHSTSRGEGDQVQVKKRKRKD